MTEAPETAAIVFADICGSAELYERSGDLQALDQIGHCLDQLACLAENHKGRIIRSKGDDLLCTFEQPVYALWAASDMCLGSLPHGLQVHVGIHYGPIVRARGDVFGDAVNVAARMLDIANPGEILTTEEFAQSLPSHEREDLRLLEQRVVKGKNQPVNIYRVLVDDSEATQVHLDTSMPTQAAAFTALQSVQIVLTMKDVELCRDESHRKLVLGRSSTCDLVVPEACVSREHATLVVLPGQAVLEDRSSTGTYVLSQGERPVHIRRETMRLVGTGVISLGRQPKTDHENLIRYREIIAAS